MNYENDSTSKLIEAVKKTAKSSSARSKTACLRDIFFEVEAALEKGVKHKQMVEALKENGLVFTLRSFETIRARIAKEPAIARYRAQKTKDLQTTNPNPNPKMEIVGMRPASNSSEKELALDLKNLTIRPDLSFDDEFYQQFKRTE